MLINNINLENYRKIVNKYMFTAGVCKTQHSIFGVGYSIVNESVERTSMDNLAMVALIAIDTLADEVKRLGHVKSPTIELTAAAFDKGLAATVLEAQELEFKLKNSAYTVTDLRAQRKSLRFSLGTLQDRIDSDLEELESRKEQIIKLKAEVEMVRRTSNSTITTFIDCAAINKKEIEDLKIQLNVQVGLALTLENQLQDQKDKQVLSGQPSSESDVVTALKRKLKNSEYVIGQLEKFIEHKLDSVRDGVIDNLNKSCDLESLPNEISQYVHENLDGGS